MAAPSLCPLCTSPLTIFTDVNGYEIGAECSSCKWRATIGWKIENLRHPWTAREVEHAMTAMCARVPQRCKVKE